jgi:GTP cyclohydrolase I
VDLKKIKEGVRLILEGIGEDPERPGLRETPERVARMYEELFEGLGRSALRSSSSPLKVKAMMRWSY